MATSQKTFGFLAAQLALMLVMTIPAKDVFALNLLTVKAPIHYECQTTLSGGLWQDEKTGEWKSGKKGGRASHRTSNADKDFA